MRASRIPRAVLTLAVLATTATASGTDDQRIHYNDCPAAVRKTLAEEARGAKIDQVTKETEDGVSTFWTSVDIGGKKYEIGVDEVGTLVEMGLEVDEDEVSYANCPAAVKKTLDEESKGAKIDKIHKDLKYGKPIYAAIYAAGEREYEIVVAQDGTLIEKTLLIDDDEIAFADCPPAVQATLRSEARGGKIGDVTRSTGIGDRVYEAEVLIRGKSYLIEVSEDGTLISKTLDDQE
jgi:hypothetical protein